MPCRALLRATASASSRLHRPCAAMSEPYPAASRGAAAISRAGPDGRTVLLGYDRVGAIACLLTTLRRAVTSRFAPRRACASIKYDIRSSNLSLATYLKKFWRRCVKTTCKESAAKRILLLERQH